MFYPYSAQLQTAAKSFSKGNFSLWFNKLIPLNNENKCEPCDEQGNDKKKGKVVQYYESKYNELKTNATLRKMLAEKHDSQEQYCAILKKADYEIIDFKAELKSPLITGIGQPHPNEIGMVFDYTMGIPYIPASSVKGIVRFAHTIGLIDSDDSSEFIKQDKEGEYIEESNQKTLIPFLFGGDLETEKTEKKEIEKQKGKVIFLDAYPDKVPDLHVDIMNPHYGEYYSKGEPPADHLSPSPLKFLTVESGTTFIFRAIVSKEIYSIEDDVRKAFQTALEVEGVGAKTTVGYGRFKIGKPHEIEKKRELEEKARKKEGELRKAELKAMSPEERDITALDDPKIIESRVVETYNRIDEFSEENRVKLAKVLKGYWETQGKWKKKNCSKKQWVKVQKVKSILGE